MRSLSAWNRVAVVGVNGAGKSTLLKIITGDTEPTDGKATIGASIEFGYFSQNSHRTCSILKNTVLEEVHYRIPHAIDRLCAFTAGAFKFSGDEADKRISVMSGGEKSRVVLATILAKPENLLILDEPTNPFGYPIARSLARGSL